MMASRLMFTARSIGLPARTGGERPLFRDVTVLLGDPRLPDAVKLDGQFGDLDLNTVDRLKHALGALDSFRFTYLDDHAQMLDVLRRKQPAFVLNLCDEDPPRPA